MRETPLSNCEREFIRSAIAEKKRLDGRQPYDYRKIKITFGIDRGCCNVEIGQTRVLAQVSSEITTPKQTRPSDGTLFVNVELSPMASPGFEVGRLSEFGVEINRLLERCLKESRCVDTESLCIISGEKVWQVRVDVHIMNHDGNLIDCASIAAITALAHFRRPDVTVDGNEVTIHPVEERDPLPLSVHHMPICVTFAFYEQGKYLLVDPTDKEEKVMDGKMVVGMNKHREICSLQVTGQMLLLKDQVLRCSNIAVVKVTEITELIHQALDNDRQARSDGKKFGFAESVSKDTIKSNQMEAEEINIPNVEEAPSPLQNGEDDTETQESAVNEPSSTVKILDKGVGSIGEGGPSTWDGVRSIGEGGPSTWEVDKEMEEEVEDELQSVQKLDSSVEGYSRLSDGLEQHVVWIVGSSIIYWVEQRAFDRKISNLELDYLGVRLYWNGVRGMKWGSLIPLLDGNPDVPEPEVLVIHLGSNDIMSIEPKILIQHMKHDLQIIRGTFPKTVIMFSEILPRIKWRGTESAEEGEQRRSLVNQKICKHVTKHGGIVIPHPGVSVDKPKLYRDDGVHMNVKGNDILIDEFGTALENYFCTKYPANEEIVSCVLTGETLNN